MNPDNAWKSQIKSRLIQITNSRKLSLGDLADLCRDFDWNWIQINFKSTFLIQICRWNLHRRDNIDYFMSGFNQKVQKRSKEVENRQNSIKIDQTDKIESKKSIDFDFLIDFDHIDLFINILIKNRSNLVAF